MDMIALTLGMAPQPQRPSFPPGVVRRIVDSDRLKRDVPEFYRPDARRDWIVAWLSANGPATCEDLCQVADSNVGVIGSDIRLLAKSGRIVCVARIKKPNGGIQKMWGHV